jgi:hypothetical protein
MSRHRTNGSSSADRHSDTDIHTRRETESDSDNERWGDDIPNVIIRAPLSSDEASTRYTAIKPALEEFLSLKFDAFFFAPVVVTPRDGPDVPALVILLDAYDSNPLPTPAELESLVGSYFVLVLGRGNFDSSVFSTTSNDAGRNYHRSLVCGNSIEMLQHEPGTLGCLWRRRIDLSELQPVISSKVPRKVRM